MKQAPTAVTSDLDRSQLPDEWCVCGHLRSQHPRDGNWWGLCMKDEFCGCPGFQPQHIPECPGCGYEPCRCDEPFDPYEAAGERHGSLPGGGSL